MRSQEEGLKWLQSICGDKGTCLDPYLGTQFKHLFKCNCSFEWKTLPNSVARGSWCPRCAGQERLTLEKLNSFCNGRGICLAEGPVSCMTKCGWKCNCGFIWRTKPNCVQQGTWCPRCSKKERWTLERIMALPRGRGKCLATRAIKGYEHCLWECNCGFVWSTTVDSINSGHWCPKEGGNLPLDPEFVRLELFKRDILIKGNYEYSMEKMELKHSICGRGFQMTWADLSQGHGCPVCAKKESKGECALFEAIYVKYPTTKRRIRGLLKNKLFELDIFLEKDGKKYAIEFDGPHHEIGHALFRPEHADRDTRKNKECVEAGIDLLRVKFSDWKSNSNEVLSKVFKWIGEDVSI